MGAADFIGAVPSLILAYALIDMYYPELLIAIREYLYSLRWYRGIEAFHQIRGSRLLCQLN